MTIQERFWLIIKELYAGNKRAFAKAIGVAPTVIENVVGSRNGNPSFDVIQKIIFAHANINPRWLIIGDGNMLIDKTCVDNSLFVNETKPQYNVVYKELLADRENKIEEKEKELREAYKEIGRLENTIEQLKKDNPNASHSSIATPKLEQQ